MNQKEIINKIFTMIPGQKIEEEILIFLQSGFRNYLYDGQDMHEAFNFKQSNIQNSSVLDGRNYNLKLSAKHVSGDGVTAKARELHKAIRRFESVQWLLWKELELPPAGCSELNYFLFRAKKYSRIDLSEKQLIRIL